MKTKKKVSNRYNPERLAEVERFVNFKISKDDELQQIVDFAAEICNCSIAMITLMDGKTQYIKFTSGVVIEKVEYTDTFCQFTLMNEDILIIPDVTKDDRSAANPFVQGAPYLRFYAGMPLLSENGNAIGTLCVFDTKTRELPLEKQEMLRSLSRQVTSLLEFDVTLQILREQYEHSLSSANTLLTYFQSSSSCHLLVDKNMRVVAFNQSMNDLMFANHGNYIKEGIDIGPYIHPEFLQEFITYFHSAMNGKNIVTERHLEYASGKICWQLTVEGAKDSSGNRSGVSFNATDITKLISNQQRMENQLDAIEKINRLQAQQLLEPIDKIIHNIEDLCRDPSTFGIPEYILLLTSAGELLEKKSIIPAASDNRG